MKLTNKHNFELYCNGHLSNLAEMSNIAFQEYVELKIVDIIPGQYNDSAAISLENEHSLRVEVRNKIAAQCLMIIVAIGKREYKKKKLADLLIREFCEAERIR